MACTYKVNNITLNGPAEFKAWLVDGGLHYLYPEGNYPKAANGDVIRKLAIPAAVTSEDSQYLDASKVSFARAWHGSPHDHDKFDLSKIGTGEGAQAFGYGLYFTDAKRIADWYKDKLTGFNPNLVAVDGVKYGYIGDDKPKLITALKAKGVSSSDAVLLISALQEYKGIEGVSANYGWIADDASESDIAISDRIMSVLDKVEAVKSDGKLYEVELSPQEDEYLDWDKPLSEQSDKVKAALKKADKQFKQEAIDFNQDWDGLGGIGANIYNDISNFSAGSPSSNSKKIGSKFLYSIGIRGIKYAAEGGKSDAKNYVIFNDNDIQIVAKFSKKDSQPYKNIVSKEKAERIVKIFRNSLNGIDNVDFIVFNNPKEAFGPDYEDNPKGFYSYQNNRNIIGIFTSALDSNKDVLDTLRHETLGHFGLNLLTPADKKAFLQAVIKSRNNKAISKVFLQVEASYKELNKDPLKIAEEVFATIDEQNQVVGFGQHLIDTLLAMVMPMLRRIGLVKGLVTKAEIRGMLSSIAESIRNKAPQKTFPKDASSQFRLADTVNNIKNKALGSRDDRVVDLDQINRILETGRMPKTNNTYQERNDKIVEMFTDSTRPFDAWTRPLPDQLKAAQLIMAKDRAPERRKVYEKEVMLKFGNQLADAIKAIQEHTKWDYRAAKEAAGYWMTARYAPIANQNLLKQMKLAEREAKMMLDNIDDTTTYEIDSLEYWNEQGQLLEVYEDAKKKRVEFEAALNADAVIDPTKQKHSVGLAGGFNNKTAKELMANIETKIPLALLNETAQHVYAMNDWKLKGDIENGKVTQETADKFDKSGLYVPLTGDPRTDDSVEDSFMIGSVNQQADKRLKGMKSHLAKNGIDASFEQVEKSARYHAWVDFKDTLTELYDDLLKSYTDDGMTEREAMREISDEYGLERNPERVGSRISDSGIIVRKNGTTFIYELNNEAAVAALKSLNNENIPTILKPIAFMSQWNARFVTSLMPGFAPINATRGLLEHSENIRTRTIPGYENVNMDKIAKRSLAIATKGNIMLVKKLSAVMAIGTPLESKLPVDENDQDVIYLREMLKEGGSSTYGDYLSTDSKALADKLKQHTSIGHKSMEIVRWWNDAFEIVPNFATYKALREQGVDEKTAATTVLNLMNFTKRGKIMTPIRALWMFAQPIAQGGHQLAKTLHTPKGRTRALAYTIAGIMLYSLLRASQDDDELGVNKLDQVGNSMLDRYIVIPIPGSDEFVKIPVGFGMQQVAWSTAYNAVRWVSGSQTAFDTVGEIFKTSFKSIAPVAPSDTLISEHPLIWAMQTFTPQPLKGVGNLALDVNAFGNPLTNQKFNREDKAKALQGRRTTPEAYKYLAKEMAALGFDVYPEQIREFARQYMPVPMIFGSLLKSYVENPAKEERGQSTVSPWIDRFILSQDNDVLREKLYYRYLNKINEVAAKESVGASLDADEMKLVGLAKEINHRTAQANGKLAAATKAEKKGEKGKAKLFRANADAMRLKNMNYLLQQMREKQ